MWEAQEVFEYSERDSWGMDPFKSTDELRFAIRGFDFPQSRFCWARIDFRRISSLSIGEPQCEKLRRFSNILSEIHGEWTRSKVQTSSDLRLEASISRNLDSPAQAFEIETISYSCWIDCVETSSSMTVQDHYTLQHIKYSWFSMNPNDISHENTILHQPTANLCVHRNR